MRWVGWPAWGCRTGRSWWPRHRVSRYRTTASRWWLQPRQCRHHRICITLRKYQSVIPWQSWPAQNDGNLTSIIPWPPQYLDNLIYTLPCQLGFRSTLATWPLLYLGNLSTIIPWQRALTTLPLCISFSLGNLTSTITWPWPWYYLGN